MMKLKKGFIVGETLIYWIIAFGIVFFSLILYLALSGRLGAMGEFIKNWLRFGR